jgi:hypothetical protein
MQPDLNILDQIQRVEAPCIESSVISERALFEAKQQLSSPILISAFAALLILISVNVLAINAKQDKSQAQSEKDSYSYLLNNNALYQ